MPSPSGFSDQMPLPGPAIPARPISNYDLKESILALFESAACQISDPDLAHHFQQVIESKRRNIPASQRL